MNIVLTKGKINGWLKSNTSPHFDKPLSLPKEKLSDATVKVLDCIKDLITFLDDPTKISQHSFYPFIGYNIIERRRSRINNGESIEKLRPIRYASHLDGYIYSYYAYKISKIYEDKVIELGLDKEVSAYRKTREGETSKSNISMSKEVFSEVKKRNNDCVALAFDIKGFYDHIDHKKLKCELESLLNQGQRLSPDMYKIYRSLTNYSYVEIKDICHYLRKKNKKNCYCKACKPKKDFKQKKLSNPIFELSYDYHKFKDWYKRKYGKKFAQNEGLKDKDNPYGIPQGSAMSSLLSNIYMLPFDVKMKKLAEDLRGMYRRYCDDIIFICDRADRKLVEKEIKSAITERGSNLIIHEIKDDDPRSKSQCFDFLSDKIKKNPLKYLGFSFDGHAVAIREEKLASYLRKSKRGIVSARRGVEAKLTERYKNGESFEKKHQKIFRREIYLRYTHLGKRNFISYANRAFSEMDDAKIRIQVKKHYKRVQELIRIEDMKLKDFFRNEEYKKSKI